MDIRLESAGSLRSAAGDAALAWDTGARLVVVTTRELADHTSDDARHRQLNHTRGGSLTGENDPAPGDGRAPAWQFCFDAPDKPGKLFKVVVAATGEVLEAWEPTWDPEATAGPTGGPDSWDACDYLAGKPLGDWTVDSVTAAQRARDAHETYKRLADSEPDEASMTLFDPGLDSGPVWSLALNHSLDHASVYVDASEGTIIPPERIVEILSSDAEGATFSGRLTISEPANEQSFQVKSAQHHFLRLVLAIKTSTPVDQVRLVVSGPQNQQAMLDWPRPPPNSLLPLQIELDDPPPGAWKAHIELRRGVLLDYDLAWCAGPGPWKGQGADPCKA